MRNLTRRWLERILINAAYSAFVGRRPKEEPRRAVSSKVGFLPAPQWNAGYSSRRYSPHRHNTGTSADGA
jgi:hypothetical protein